MSGGLAVAPPSAVGAEGDSPVEEDGGSSPVYDYASDADADADQPKQPAADTTGAGVGAEQGSPLATVRTPAPGSPSLSFAPTPPPLATPHSLITPTTRRRLEPSSATQRSGNEHAFSASSVRTLASSAAATVVAPAAAPPSPTAAAPRNLSHTFDPIQLSPSPLASQLEEPSSQLPSRPTPPPARVSWPISFSNSKSQLAPSSQKSSRAKRKLPNAASSAALSQSETATGSRFATCPVCEKTVALFDIDRHLDSGCDRHVKVKLQKKEDTPAAAKGQLKRAGSFQASQLQSSESGGSSFTRCPLCDESVPLATINHHLDIECRKEPRKTHAPTSPHSALTTAAATTASAVASGAGPGPLAAVPQPNEEAASAPAATAAASDSDPEQIKSSTPTDTDPVLSGPNPTAVAAPMVPSPPAGDGECDLAASAESVAASSPHPFFTAGPRAASAFIPQRKGRNDSVVCALVSYFSLARSPAPPPTVPPLPPLDQFECAWQDCDEATSDLSRTQQLNGAHVSAPFYSNTKCHEPSVELWANVCVAANEAALRSAPILDLHSPQLLCNARQPHRFRLSQFVLKSMLQKSVRLSRPAAAVRIALQLMQSDLSQFLRRISVIMFEDAILHPKLPLVVWMMVACGKRYLPTPFQPTLDHINALLQMVHDIASVSTKDALLPGETLSSDSAAASAAASKAEVSHSQEEEEEDHDADSMTDQKTGTPSFASPSSSSAGASGSSPSTVPPPTLLDALPSLTAEQRLLIKCMLVRACFGGSPGDVAMVRSYAALWCKRFESENAKLSQAAAAAAASASSSASSPAVRQWLPFLTSLHATSQAHLPSHLVLRTPVDVRHVSYLHDDDLVLSGIDFHCSNIIQLLLKKETTLRVLQQHGYIGSSCEAVLCRVMWEFRSALTNKQTLRPMASPVVDPHLAEIFAALKADIDLTAKRILQRTVEM